MRLITIKRAISSSLLALAATVIVLPHHAHGARLYFKDGDYIDGHRVYERRGNICLEVVKGAGGTIVYGRNEIDLDRTFAASAKPGKKVIRHHDEEQSGSDQPVVFSDANIHGSSRSADITPSAEPARSGVAVKEQQAVSRQASTPQAGGLSVQIQSGGQVGYMRTVSEQEKRTASKTQDPTRYYGRIEKDGTALFTNSEGRTLRGYISDDGVGSVMDEQQKMIRVEPRQ